MAINSKVSASLHPSKIVGDSQGAKSGRRALEALYAAAGQVHDLNDIVQGKAIRHQQMIMSNMPTPPVGKRKPRPPLIIDQGAADHIISVGTPLASKALAVADVAINTITESISRLDSAISLKVLAGKSPRSQELRMWAAGQKNSFQELGKRFQRANENGALVAAILEGEPMLANLTPANHALLHKQAADVLAPDEVQAHKESTEALRHLTSAAKVFTESTAAIFNNLSSPTAGAIEQVIKGDA